MDQLTSLSLCSGGAGLDLGLQLVVPLRTVCWVEWEAFAIEYLASAMEAGCLDQSPIWTDLRTFDGLPWRGVVDCLTAGYPCQPFSLAGKRRGHEDPRHLWPHVHRVISEVEPALVFLENVPGHLSLGFDQVVYDLETLGYQVAAGLFSAEEVGASHKRERLFILAYKYGFAKLESNNRQRTDARQDSRKNPGWEACRQDAVFVGDGLCKGLEERLGQRSHLDEELATPERAGMLLFPPGPADVDAWLRILEQHPSLAPATEPEVRRMADGLARADWLRLLGNGVVPLQAAYAFCSLWAARRGGVECLND